MLDFKYWLDNHESQNGEPNPYKLLKKLLKPGILYKVDKQNRTMIHYTLLPFLCLLGTCMKNSAITL